MKTVVHHSLAVAVAAALTIGVPVAQAGTVTGPGASHTVNPGDTREFWFVEDGAQLNIAPGGAVGGVQVDAAHVLGNSVDVRGLIGIRLSNASTATINGGQIVIPSSLGDAGGAQSGSKMNLDAMTVTSAGRGFSVGDAGSELTLRNSSISAGGEALQVGDGGLLVLDNVSATSDGSASGAFGIGLRMYGGTARVSNSTLSGASGGVRMEGAGQLFVERSSIDNGLIMLGSISDPTQRSQATLIGSIVTGSTAAGIQNGSELTIAGSALRGTGTSTSSAGASLINASLKATAGSLIEGAGMGIRVSGSTQNTLEVDQSKVVSGSGAALSVASNAKLDALIANGSSIEAGNGVALELERGAGANVRVSGSTIRGDMLARPTGTAPTELNVDLADRSMLVGAIVNGSTVSVSDSVWRLTGDSSVQQLSTNTGSIIELGNGSSFNTLTVAGNFTGNDGTLIFNTVLAGDDAATDKLVIGGDTSGTANVRVNNVGGAGAQTRQGIELISVGGASNGQFNLSGRAVGGQYEYFLHKGTGADGNWYLRSQLPTLPDPCEANPSLPQCPPVDPVDPVDPVNPEPVLRPEPGAYLANLQDAQTMFRVGYHDRNAGQNSGRAWARVDGSRNGFDAVSRQLDIRGNSQALTVGADLWRHDSGSSVGVMLSSGNASSTSTNVLTGYYARGKVKGEALGLYGTWRGGNGADPYAGFYVDGSLQRAQFRNRVEGIGLDAERYDSRAWQGAVETGYAFRVGGAINGGIYLEPQLQVGYSRWDSSRHTEANGTVVTAENANGMFGRAGLRLSGVTRWGNGAAEVQPYLAANWLHTRAESQIRMDDEIADARVPRSRGEFSGGASVKFANGIGAWGGLSLQKASGYHQTSAQVGVSYSW
ncbi:autotransporter outer membrane beta-barrel domain-containing protein [Stenotrophomonas maltophilia]|uniref:autotransporter family protein n=1 Tax=Stenotrophomonas maltophilia TaxID=40324 RepID=UPI000DA984E3|nr:autotransporter outer membrane beta-barrel domain-containing protein [Stenotrophomonas maltophilia]PZS81387.1 autotransporter outer membrane beta-barrel domain-containing protein [Stenotrophomonas maltophilia]HDS1213804.1 autotransporter outer membrane beta-barrel domain-containing protein [Stenotrophomonas maltophilia]